MATEISTNPEMVPELWFEDANVIFHAGNKLFRVHRSILSKRSSIFNDMFSMPQSPQGEATDDGCTRIHLPDREMDVYYFFLAIFDSSFFEGPPSTPPIAVMIAILRLASKYDIGFLKHRAISHLNILFPSDRTAWAEAVHHLYPKFGLKDLRTRLLLLELMELAEIVDTKWIMPSACHAFHSLHLSDILSHESWNRLPPAFQKRYIIARESLTEAIDNSGSWLLRIPPQSCPTPVACNAAKLKMVDKHSAYGLGWITHALVNSPGDWAPSYGKFCAQCTAMSKTEATAAVDKGWNNCPKMLGLQSWDVLKAEKVAFETVPHLAP
ncbi:hypothetical protein BDZ97DRAFT_1763973 [Flammula alnicola]|nr:hypothetical protein BDZ97DRAFT_1763973 [Flammula alnicola]